MFCPNCGEKVEDDWNICPKCGKRLREESVNESNSNNVDNVPQDTRQDEMAQESTVNEVPKTKISLWGKIFGWGLLVFCLFFGIIMLTESVAAGLLSIAASVFFCPKIWEKTNKKVLCIIIAIVLYLISWTLFLSTDDGNTVEMTAEQGNQITQKENESDSPISDSTTRDDSNEPYVGWDAAEEIEPAEFYPTDTIDCGDWSVTVWLAWTSKNEVWGDQEVNCLCDITNISGDEKTFYASDVFELDNNGLVDDASSDYDGQRITSGTTVRMKLYFSFPENSNTFLDAMRMDANSKTILFTAKPQSKEKVAEFEGTYEGSGMKLVFVETSSGVYHTFDFNSLRGIEEYDISLDENNCFWIGRCQYIWIPEESAIYTTDVDGNPDRESYYFVKSNFEEINTVPREKVEIGELYYFSGGAELSLTKKEKTGTIVMFVLIDDNNAQIEFTGTFEYQDDMTKPIPIKIDSEYSDYANEKIAFPDGLDGGLIVLSDDTSDGEMEFQK